MPVPLTGLDLTNIFITTVGTNLWDVQIRGITTGLMGSRINDDDYVDAAEVSPAEAIVLHIDDISGTEVLDFAYGDTFLLTLDAVGITIHLDENILANTDYYLDENGVPFTDSALTTFIGIGEITEENIDGIENTDIDIPEVGISEGISASEETGEELEYSTSESLAISESNFIEAEQEIEESVNTLEENTGNIGIAGGWTKTSPSSNDNWVKKDGDIA